MAINPNPLPWPVSPTEAARLRDLRSFDILDTPAEEPFDGIVEIAAALFEVPIAAITLMDSNRQWFKAKVGTTICGTGREHAFCRYAILGQESMVVEDMAQDERFTDHPFVVGPPHLRFYAGALLVSDRGLSVGSLCVLDVQPRVFDRDRLRLLERLARQAMDALETRRLVRLMAESCLGP